MFLTGRPDIAAVVFNDLLDDRKPDAASALCAVPRCIRAKEPVKDIRQVFCRNAFSVILDLHLNAVIVINDTDHRLTLTGNPASSVSGTVVCRGYYTIELNTPVDLNPGQKFAIVVKVPNPFINANIKRISPYIKPSSSITLGSAEFNAFIHIQ